MKKLYVIAGCNGAGKTTASYTILPDILDCKEFVNADERERLTTPLSITNSFGIKSKKNTMNNSQQLKEERDKIVKGLEETYKRLIEYKKQKKSPMVVLRNGEIIEVNPNEILPTTKYGRKSD